MDYEVLKPGCSIPVAATGHYLRSRFQARLAHRCILLKNKRTPTLFDEVQYFVLH